MSSFDIREEILKFFIENSFETIQLIDGKCKKIYYCGVCINPEFYKTKHHISSYRFLEKNATCYTCKRTLKEIFEKIQEFKETNSDWFLYLLKNKRSVIYRGSK